MKSLLFAISILGFTLCHANHNWAKIEDNHMLTGQRSYQKDNVTIHLVGLIHLGEERYFNALNNLITDKIVVYEPKGGTFEQQTTLSERIKALGKEYVNRFRLISQITNPSEGMALKFKLAEQRHVLNYSLASRAVHADFVVDSLLSINSKPHFFEH